MHCALAFQYERLPALRLGLGIANEATRRATAICIAPREPPGSPEEVPAAVKLATALALGPMFSAQILGEPFFVPVYGPLLIACVAVESRLDGPPVAIALSFATLVYASGMNVFGSPPETLPITVAINAAATLSLILTESDEAKANSRLEGSANRGKDRALALVLTLALSGLLVATAIPVGSLRP